MERKYTFGLCFFGVIFIGLFLGGILGILFTVRHYTNVLALEGSENIETATITSIHRGRRSGSTIHFMIQNDEMIYRTNIMTSGLRVGDEIEVKFNEDRSLFLVATYQSEVFIGFIAQVILFAILFALSIIILVIFIRPEKITHR